MAIAGTVERRSETLSFGSNPCTIFSEANWVSSSLEKKTNEKKVQAPVMIQLGKNILLQPMPSNTINHESSTVHEKKPRSGDVKKD